MLRAGAARGALMPASKRWFREFGHASICCTVRSHGADVHAGQVLGELQLLPGQRAVPLACMTSPCVGLNPECVQAATAAA